MSTNFKEANQLAPTAETIRNVGLGSDASAQLPHEHLIDTNFEASESAAVVEANNLASTSGTTRDVDMVSESETKLPKLLSMETTGNPSGAPGPTEAQLDLPDQNAVVGLATSGQAAQVLSTNATQRSCASDLVMYTSIGCLTTANPVTLTPPPRSYNVGSLSAPPRWSLPESSCQPPIPRVDYVHTYTNVGPPEIPPAEQSQSDSLAGVDSVQAGSLSSL